MAHFVSALFRLKPKPSETQAEKEIEKSRRKDEAESAGPKGLSARYDNRVFYVNESTSSDFIVFYMHGGGYQHDFSPFHWKFIQKIIDGTDAAVIAPAYHLIPFGACRDAFSLIVPLYRRYTEEMPEKKFILMGDSFLINYPIFFYLCNITFIEIAGYSFGAICHCNITLKNHM